MEIDTLTNAPAAPTSPPSAAEALGADDFLQLLVTQLTNQDPLEPTSNEVILEQLSSIREIQLSTTLTESLQTLTGNQRFGSAAALIGKQVAGTVGKDPAIDVSGRVTAVQFDPKGNVILQLDTGDSVPLERVQTVADPAADAQSLIGRTVRGTSGDEVVEGLVTAVRSVPNRTPRLELDTGDDLAVTAVVGVS